MNYEFMTVSFVVVCLQHGVHKRSPLGCCPLAPAICCEGHEDEGRPKGDMQLLVHIGLHTLVDGLQILASQLPPGRDLAPKAHLHAFWWLRARAADVRGAEQVRALLALQPAQHRIACPLLFQKEGKQSTPCMASRKPLLAQNCERLYDCKTFPSGDLVTTTSSSSESAMREPQIHRAEGAQHRQHADRTAWPNT